MYLFMILLPEQRILQQAGEQLEACKCRSLLSPMHHTDTLSISTTDNTLHGYGLVSAHKRGFYCSTGLVLCNRYIHFARVDLDLLLLCYTSCSNKGINIVANCSCLMIQLVFGPRCGPLLALAARRRDQLALNRTCLKQQSARIQDTEQLTFTEGRNMIKH